jgi:hypothetical protein
MTCTSDSHLEDFRVVTGLHSTDAPFSLEGFTTRKAVALRIEIRRLPGNCNQRRQQSPIVFEKRERPFQKISQADSGIVLSALLISYH